VINVAENTGKDEATERMQQKNITFIHKYAESLEGRQSMHQKIITVKNPPSEKKKDETADKKKVVSKKDQKVAAGKSKADLLKEENLARKVSNRTL
jgi:hypothetical protein